MAWLLFRSAGRLYQVDLGCVDELVTPGPIVRVPCSPAFLLGLITHDRTAIPVVDLSRVAGTTGGFVPDPASILVFRGEQGMWGVPIDRTGLRVVHEDLEASLDPASGATQRPDPLDLTAIWEQVRHAIETWFQALPAADEALSRDAMPNESSRLAEGGPWAHDVRSLGGEPRPSA